MALLEKQRSDMNVPVHQVLYAGGGGFTWSHLLPSARANWLSPSPPAASGMRSTVGFVGGFFRLGDLLACVLSMLPGLHMIRLLQAQLKSLGCRPAANPV